MEFQKNGVVEIQLSSKEDEAVHIAATNLKSDLFKVLKSRVAIHYIDWEELPTVFGVQNGPCVMEQTAGLQYPYTVKKIVVATRKHFEALQLLQKTVASALPDQREAYAIVVEDSVLYLCGNDRRGTIYAVYDFCEQLGVSPWYFFADVVPKRRDNYVIPEHTCKVDFPSVAYRGIFINDEEELEKWVHAYMGEETI